MTIKFTASDEQIKQLAANAINASSPMGLGILHYNYQSWATTYPTYQELLASVGITKITSEE